MYITHALQSPISVLKWKKVVSLQIIYSIHDQLNKASVVTCEGTSFITRLLNTVLIIYVSVKYKDLFLHESARILVANINCGRSLCL